LRLSPGRKSPVFPSLEDITLESAGVGTSKDPQAFEATVPQFVFREHTGDSVPNNLKDRRKLTISPCSKVTQTKSGRGKGNTKLE
jgi:hypothetical protein